MNALASECSSGCESGWTLYLEHSFLNHNASHRGTQYMGETDGFYEEYKDKRAQEEEYEEEDLSMVSDASSGPPHFPDNEAYFNEEENGGVYSASKAVKLAKSGTRKQKDKENHHHKDQQHLHDTASSCVFDFSTNEVAGNTRQTSTESMLDYSQGFSANYFKGGRSSFHQHMDFLQSSLSENELQGNKWYGGKEIGMR